MKRTKIVLHLSGTVICRDLPRENPRLLSPYCAASAGPAEAPSSPRLCEEKLQRHRQLARKPELDDYTCLNFVSSEASRPGTATKMESQSTKSPAEIHTIEEEEKTEPGHEIAGGDGGECNVECGEEADRIWRGKFGRNRGRQAAYCSHRNKKLGDQISGGIGEILEPNTDSEQYDKDSRMYPRTLGSSVSILDEKDSVTRNVGTRFAGEDPMKRRLRGADPFQWIGCLHAGAARVNGLVDQADSALRGIGGSITTSSASGESATVDSGTGCPVGQLFFKEDSEWSKTFGHRLTSFRPRT